MDETVEERDLNDLLKVFGSDKSAVSIFCHMNYVLKVLLYWSESENFIFVVT